ncbi:RIP metalloprotease RseP-like protein [Eubacterium nodatum ATCC 33099]|nr:RIP metalloprotease RseP-like protein [Eubacterium nodatum ATCC 33099]
MLTVILALVLFLFLIFPHELGHFMMARAVGVKVNEFAFGMGPAVWQKQGRETLYSIRIFPVGGFCAMEGENEESDQEGAFNNKPWWAKILVLIAGAAMNVLIAAVVMSVIILISGTATTTVDKVENGSPAQIAGLKQGDKIEYISGKKIEDWNDVSKSIGNKGKKIEIKVSRNGKYEIFKINPRKEKDRYVIGITPVIEKSPSKAIIGGFKSTWYITRQMYKSLGMLASGNVAMKDVSGPVGMIGLVHQSAARGLISFFYLVALISLNLAIFNLLPLPALDGGRIIFVIIRMITGKAITDKQEAMVHGAGMVLLLSLMVFVTWNDIIKLFK